MKRIVLWLFLTVILKQVVWSLFIPLWHFPDEQAHFGHVAYLAEGETSTMGRNKDLTQEISISEQFLGTYRNKYGNTAFTYHPEYRLEYTGNYEGKFEQEIKNQSLAARKNFTDAESAYYPHFYYSISALIYKLFYLSDLFVRVFSIRIFWLFTNILLIYFAFLIGKIIFPKDQLASLSVAILTGFQPMLTFVAGGISSDNLHNLFFTAVIYFCLKIWQKIHWLNMFGLAIVLVFGFINKPQFSIALGIVIPVLLWQIIKQKKYKLLVLSILVFLSFALVFGKNHFSGMWASLQAGRIPYFEIKSNLARPEYSLWQHLDYSVKHTFSEVLPWYWGVFRWLSLTLPRWVNQVMMRLLLIAGIGLILKIWRRKFEPGFWLIVWSAAVYFLALFFWDFQQVRNAGFPFGLQGRYYFPVIVPHLVLLIMGLKQIWSGLVKPLMLWFIGLNWIALYWVLASYYDAGNFNTFITQASQYKPDFAKGIWLILALGLYAVLSVILTLKLIYAKK